MDNQRSESTVVSQEAWTGTPGANGRAETNQQETPAVDSEEIDEGNLQHLGAYSDALAEMCRGGQTGRVEEVNSEQTGTRLEDLGAFTRALGNLDSTHLSLGG